MDANLVTKMMNVAMDHSKMNHSAMDHSTMNHSIMDQSAIGHDMSSMDHAAMGHDKSGGMDHSMMGMVMSFHGGYKETVLFDFWQTKTVLTFVVSCIALFVCAALYEGLKLAREKLIAYELKKSGDQLNGNRPAFVTRNCHCESNNSQKNEAGNCEEAEILNVSSQHECCSKNAVSSNDTKNHLINQTNNSNNNITIKSFSTRLLSRGHLCQTLLHMLQITVSYLLMLVFMTYNTWLCLAVVLGAGAGYFIFGVHRLTSIDVNEHCH